MLCLFLNSVQTDRTTNLEMDRQAWNPFPKYICYKTILHYERGRLNILVLYWTSLYIVVTITNRVDS